MNVPGRADAFRHHDLEQAVLPGGVVLADLDRLEHPEQPERLAFVRVQRVPGLGPLLRDRAHAALLPERLLRSPTVYEETVAKRTISGRTIIVKPISRAAALLAALLRECTGASRRSRCGARTGRRHLATLVRRSRPPRGITGRSADERARRPDPL